MLSKVAKFYRRFNGVGRQVGAPPPLYDTNLYTEFCDFAELRNFVPIQQLHSLFNGIDRFSLTELLWGDLWLLLLKPSGICPFFNSYPLHISPGEFLGQRPTLSMLGVKREEDDCILYNWSRGPIHRYVHPCTSSTQYTRKWYLGLVTSDIGTFLKV